MSEEMSENNRDSVGDGEVRNSDWDQPVLWGPVDEVFWRSRRRWRIGRWAAAAVAGGCAADGGCWRWKVSPPGAGECASQSLRPPAGGGEKAGVGLGPPG